MSPSIANPLLTLRLTSAKAVDECSTGEEASGRIRQLTRGLAAGEEAAFRQFHADYFDRLYRFLLVVAHGQEEEAKEALQQTLLRVVRYARPFDSADAFWSWLRVVARSAARDAGRKQQRYLALLERFSLREQNQAQDQISDGDDRLREALEETLEELDATGRLLLEGKYLENTTVKELCRQTGLSEKAVESRLVRLRHHLRERMLKKLRTV